MAIPDIATARRLLDEADLPDGIVVHSEGVARVAAEAARMVREAGVAVDAQLIEAAALLHDIDKPTVRQRGGVHGETGARMLEEMGFAELAAPVASHPLPCLLDEERFPRGWPSVLVAVADRRVAQGFVSIDERLSEMAERHPEHRAAIGAARDAAHALERELVDVTGLAPEAVEDRLRAAWEAGARASGRRR